MKRNLMLWTAVVMAGIVVFVILRPDATEHETTTADVEVDETPRTPRAEETERRERRPGVVYDETGIAIGGVERRPSGTPLNIDYIIEYHDRHTVVSLDARDTFTVPLPGDPEWPDYLEYRRAFPSMNDNSRGYAVAYDPEWRTVLSGRRPAPEPGMGLFGGSDSLRGLVEMVLEELGHENEIGLLDLAITKEEFEIICWSSFPQSRPYVRTPWEDAWRFQYANYRGGIREAREQAGGRPLDVVSIGYDEIADYEHFELYNGVSIEAKDTDTGEILEFDWLDSIIERDGVYKVYLYKN